MSQKEFKKRNPGLFRARDIIKEKISQQTWIIPDVLSRDGVTYCIAPPKKGKSTLASNIAVDTSEGVTAFGNIPLDGPIGVLYLLLEGDRKRRRVNRMLKSLLSGRKCPYELQIFTTETFPLMPGAITKLEDILSHNKAIKLVIIDRFIQIRQQEKQVNYNKDMDDIQKIRDVAENFEVAFLLIDHPRKQESANWIDLVSGSYGVAGTVDNLLFLDRKEGSTHAKIKVQGRDVDENVFTTSFDQRTKRLTITGSGYLPKTEQEVYDVLLSDGGAMKLSDIAKEVEGDTDAVRKRLERLILKGRVEKDGKGYYKVKVRRASI